MSVELPKVEYKGRVFVVDFRLGELRTVKPPMRTVEFAKLKDEEFKAELRGIRSKTWRNEYVKGLDD